MQAIYRELTRCKRFIIVILSHKIAIIGSRAIWKECWHEFKCDLAEIAGIVNQK